MANAIGRTRKVKMRTRCNQCEALMINGVFCHETGCANAGARFDAQSGEWIKQRTCFSCGCEIMTAAQLRDDIEVLRELGQKAALARHHQDEPTAKFHTDYMRRFIDARPAQYKTELRASFNQAYRQEAEVHINFAMRYARK